MMRGGGLVVSQFSHHLRQCGVRPFMRSCLRSLSRDIGQPTCFSHPELIGEGEILPGIHRSEFAQRRSNFIQRIALTHTGMTNSKHLVIIPASPIKYMSADVPYRFHQNNDLLYLTGFQEPDAVLVMESTSLPDFKTVLYVRPRDPFRELWDGPRAGTEGALQFLGVDETYTVDQLGEHLEKKYSAEGYSVWYYTEEVIHPDNHELIVKSLTHSPHSTIKSVHSPVPHLSQLRLIKSAGELQLMKKAGELTAKAFRLAMAATRPGVNESVLESVFEQSVKSGGAQWMSFPPVVAGGNRATCLHYISNNRALNDGELVLMDAGCEYHGYVSDVTRTWPVGGKFKLAQKDLYQVVRSAKEEIIKMCRPGVTLNYLHSAVVEILADGLRRMGVISDRLSGMQLYQAMNRLYPHHVGHYLGMDTHDTLSVDRNTVLSAGMVITVEPGVYVPHNFPCSHTKLANELQGTGVRLEDDVLITERDAEILNRGTPDTVDEIANVMR